MIRSNAASSMQKTYDDCYLMCSTAVYFEQQNAEDEALKQWRSALDAIYYHNAYKVPPNYRPKSETERALQESLHDMEMQCKERVDLLDALRKSRLEASNEEKPRKKKERSRPDSSASRTEQPQHAPFDNSFAGGSVPPVNYSDISRPGLPQRNVPSTPPRPEMPTRKPSDTSSLHNLSTYNSQPNAPSGTLDVPPPKRGGARTPSPEKRSGFKTTLRPSKEGRAATKLAASTLRTKPTRGAGSAAQAATLAWPGVGQPVNQRQTNSSSVSLPLSRSSGEDARNASGAAQGQAAAPTGFPRSQIDNNIVKPPSPSDYLPATNDFPSSNPYRPQPFYQEPPYTTSTSQSTQTTKKGPPPPVPPHRSQVIQPSLGRNNGDSLHQAPLPKPEFPTYRREYPEPTPLDPRKVNSISANRNGVASESTTQVSSDTPQSQLRTPPAVPRKAVPKTAKSAAGLPDVRNGEVSQSSSSETENPQNRRKQKKQEEQYHPAELPAENVDSTESASAAWDARVAHLMKNLPRGCDEQAAKAIFNEVVIKGDEVHWEDVAGLDSAKNALKEAVVYPFLRPDLFLGLREPARGILLFGPPGTGKTMLARAVATESQSTFFAISASSLTSKYLGESEKLVRALFLLAKALTPAIIFVDEIDSLLSARAGSGEHEATRRIKTEFLIQWSDLAKAAAGRETKDTDGDASRVLVLAATNLPWAIDDAAKRRFVRRQYIPLPEPHVREDQMRRLISAQKHNLSDHEIQDLVALTDGFSGSDITALAKDAAMGPLRSLGEQLLHMSPEDIRPIAFEDFEASLVNIRPSVGKQGLKDYEDWAKQYGERAG